MKPIHPIAWRRRQAKAVSKIDQLAFVRLSGTVGSIHTVFDGPEAVLPRPRTVTVRTIEGRVLAVRDIADAVVGELRVRTLRGECIVPRAPIR